VELRLMGRTWASSCHACGEKSGTSATPGHVSSLGVPRNVKMRRS
jgi:hypothetical protein